MTRVHSPHHIDSDWTFCSEVIEPSSAAAVQRPFRFSSETNAPPHCHAAVTLESTQLFIKRSMPTVRLKKDLWIVSSMGECGWGILSRQMMYPVENLKLYCVGQNLAISIAGNLFSTAAMPANLSSRLNKVG